MNKNNLKNPRNTITPNEINKFIYCPYQWYYERKYGTDELKRLHNEIVLKYNLEDKTKSNFVKGLEFHNNYGNKNKFKRIVKNILFSVILILMMYFYYKYFLF